MATSVILDGNKNQSVVVSLQPLDSTGSPTNDVAGFAIPTWTVDTPGALIISDNINGQNLPWQYNITLPITPIPGTFAIEAVTDTIIATGTVTVTYVPGPMVSMALNFGTPTPALRRR